MTRNHSRKPAAEAPATTATSGAIGEERSWLIFRLGTQTFCASTLDVDGIIERPQVITAIPKMPSHALGAFLFRDHSALAISLRKKLQVKEGEDGAKCPFIVARVGEARMALCVDEVLDVIGAGDVSWTPMPEMLGGDLFDLYAIREGDIVLHTSFRRLVEVEVDFEVINRWSAQTRREATPARPDAPAPFRAGSPGRTGVLDAVKPEPQVRPPNEVPMTGQTGSPATRASAPTTEVGTQGGAAQHLRDATPDRPDASAPLATESDLHTDILDAAQPAIETSTKAQTASSVAPASLRAPELRIAQPHAADLHTASAGTHSSAATRGTPTSMNHARPDRPDHAHRIPAIASGNVEHGPQGFGTTPSVAGLDAERLSGDAPDVVAARTRADSLPAHQITTSPPPNMDAEEVHTGAPAIHGRFPPPRPPHSAHSREQSPPAGRGRWVAGALLAAAGLGWLLYALTPGREDRPTPAAEPGREKRSSSVAQVVESPVTSGTSGTVRDSPATPRTELAGLARVQPDTPPSTAREVVVLESDAVTVTVTRADKKQAVQEMAVASGKAPASQPAPAGQKIQETSGKPPSPAAGSVYTHVVRPGETLSGIAKTYLRNAHRYPELARLSGIENPHLIYPGDTVRIAVRQSPR